MSRNLQLVFVLFYFVSPCLILNTCIVSAIFGDNCNEIFIIRFNLATEHYMKVIILIYSIATSKNTLHIWSVKVK